MRKLLLIFKRRKKNSFNFKIYIKENMNRHFLYQKTSLKYKSYEKKKQNKNKSWMVLKHQAEKIFFFQKNMLSFVEILKKKSFRKKRISINNKKKLLQHQSIYIWQRW